MVKVNSLTVLAFFFLIAALLFSSTATRLRKVTGSSHLDAHSAFERHSNGPRKTFSDHFDQDIRDNSTIYPAPQPDFSHQTRLFFGEQLKKHYYALWWVLGFVCAILFPLAVDHATIIHTKKEQKYLVFIMFSSFAYALVGLGGVCNHMFVTGSTLIKTLDIFLSAASQVYTGVVAIFYWKFLRACLDFAHSDIALSLDSRSIYHQFHSYDLRFLLPKPVFFTQIAVKKVLQRLYRYIFLRIIGMIVCILAVQYVSYHSQLEIILGVSIFCWEVTTYYWVELFFEVIRGDLKSPILHKIHFYVQVLVFVSSYQEWLLKLLCWFFHLLGMKSLFMIDDVPLVQNSLLMLEAVLLAVSVYGRFTAGAYLSFVLAVRCPDLHMSRKGN